MGWTVIKKEQLHFGDRLVWVWVQRTAGSGTFSLPSYGRETPEILLTLRVHLRGLSAERRWQCGSLKPQGPRAAVPDA